jgi:hypothetical protein
MKLNSPFIWVGLVALSAACSGAAENVPELATAYSASLRGNTGGTEINARIWIDGKKQRIEMTMADTVSTSLVREDTGDIFHFSDDSDRAMRMDYDATMGNLMSAQQIEMMNPRFEGRETVNGEATLRFAISGENARGWAQQGRVWFTPDGILVKTDTTADFGGEALHGLTELFAIERGAQDPSLFELPPGMNVETL